MSNWIQDARQAVNDDDLAEGLKVFASHNQDSRTEDTLILLTGRWNRLRREERQGTISRSDAEVERNRIRHALLDMLREAEEKLPSSAATEDNPNHAINVNGDGNIIIQGVSGSTINISK